MHWIWRIVGQQPRLAPWEAQPFSAGVEEGPRPGDARDCHERVVACEAPGEPAAAGPYRRLAAAIFRCDIFPPALVRAVLSADTIAVGATVGVCYHFVPGLDLFFAARVTACFEEQVAGGWGTGFTYRTLAGHPVCGEETFSVEKDSATGRIVVALRSWSRPGSLLARVAKPFLRLVQLRAGRAALDHLAHVAQRASRSGPLAA